MRQVINDPNDPTAQLRQDMADAMSACPTPAPAGKPLAAKTLAEAISDLRIVEDTTTARQARKATGTYTQGFNDAIEEALGLALADWRANRPQDDPDLGDDLLDFLDNYVDVLDGSNGFPRPNKAMDLHMRLKQAMGRRD